MSEQSQSGEAQSMGRHQSIPPQNVTATAHQAERIDDSLDQAEPGWALEVACCCPSRPAVRVVMPASADRPRPAELLLCGHHYRASRERLVRSRASVYDRAGALISSAAAGR
jgi:hypothetical protein